MDAVVASVNREIISLMGPERAVAAFPDLAKAVAAARRAAAAAAAGR